MEELNSGPPNTNPSSGREEDLNPGPPDYKASALTTRPRRLLQLAERGDFPIPSQNYKLCESVTTCPKSQYCENKRFFFAVSLKEDAGSVFTTEIASVLCQPLN